MSLNVAEEIIARQPPEAQAIIRAVAGEDCRIGVADRGIGTAGERQNAAKFLPAAQHATSTRPAAAAETQVEEETRRAARPRETRAAADSHRRMRRREPAEADRMPPLRREALRQRPRAAAASGVGIARDQAACDRISTASADVSLLRRNDVCGTAPRRATGAVGAAIDGAYGAADGLLSSEQAADGRVPQHVLGSAVLPGADGENPKPSDGGVAAVV